MNARLGIIAGAGRFPSMVLSGAKKAGCHVTVIGLKGLADPSLAAEADVFRWAGVTCLGRWIRLLNRSDADRVILAGAVRKTGMYGRWRILKLLPDWTAFRLWFFELPDKRNDTVLSAVANVFARHGIKMEHCTQYSAQDMAPEGVLTSGQPSPSQLKDIDFGWPIAKGLGQFDIGQSVAVKDTEVIAVEAIEGTDRMIQRAGELCRRGGWTMIKVAKPNQDMRFDVPTVGPETIATLKTNGAKLLVIEAGKTVIVDRQKMIANADASGIVVLARRQP